MHYRSNCCDSDHNIIELKKDGLFSRLIESYIREIFNNIPGSKDLIKYYFDLLNEGLNVGYSPTSLFYDADLASALKNDIALFSAFKESSFRKQLESFLTENGEVVPWSKFKKKALELNVEYNERYLKTEYHHTVATANNVEKWKSFVADADLYPNLKYNAINDSRTREKHRILDGLILPINHPFWKDHMTPIDWGCRCDVEQTDEDPSDVIPEFEAKAGFKNNAAISQKIFGEIAYKDTLSKKEIKDAEKAAIDLLEE
ncbi:hypothetical protein GJU43_13965 [Flavobacterium sp. LC2016-23]|uniref:phage head morphogenesis protein n=1 Tax=Flavobacterium sp. LC2016-23 TaxID=2666330 RepID=UPI0012AF3E55|nr:phage minor head protein [Flavobacterium sp. LC2016-23]MRX40389.1 hypothetical protein [Flavobacterium sp. LC2016-23]